MTQPKRHPTQTDDPICHSDEMAGAVLSSLSAHIAIVDAEGQIMKINQAWLRFAIENGMPADYNPVGQNYLEICQGAPDAQPVGKGLKAVIAGQTDEFLFDYPCHTPTGPRWFYMRAVRLARADPLRVIISHEDITALKLAESALDNSRQALVQEKKNLEEANIALKVILQQREADKDELEHKVLTNINDLVLPYVYRLKSARIRPQDKAIVDIIDNHLRDIVSPLIQRLSHLKIILTPQEMQVAAMVKDGKSSKEIADVLNVSHATIHFHRKNLRKKLGLSHTRANLRTYLLSIG